MQNELLLMISLVVIYVSTILLYRWFGRTGLYIWTSIATIAANIEVLIIVNAFGMEQTLGNILFASTFLVTDILSETESKKAANKAVKIGIVTNIIFVFLSQSWFYYIPAKADWASPAIQTVFSNTPRFMIVGIVVYGIVQVYDVWAYHAIWKQTAKILKDPKKGLWIRNNGSTLVSQLLNTVLFTFGAFIGTYDIQTLVGIAISSYVIFIFTSVLDTPIIYIARKWKNQGKIANDLE